MIEPSLSTRDVLSRLGLSESALRHLLRRPDCPRPAIHPTARLFLWTETDVEALASYAQQVAKGRGESGQ